MVVLSSVAFNPARGILIPAQEMVTDQDAAEQERKGGYWAYAFDPERLTAMLRQQVGGLALSFDYRHGTQDFVNVIRPPYVEGSGPARVVSDTTLDTYGLRPELVLTNWLSIYGVAAWHDGSNSAPPTDRTPAFSLSLDGHALGAGVSGVFGLPVMASCIEGVTLDPFFVLPDLNWTHNEFDDIENGIDVLNVTTRVGFGARTTRFNLGLYGGPMYQQVTELQYALVPESPVPIPVETRPQDAWSGVVGAFLGMRISQNPGAQDRPTLLLTVEGGVGNRESVLVSLRYEYDLLAGLGIDANGATR
jgi:hypothetical protein